MILHSCKVLQYHQFLSLIDHHLKSKLYFLDEQITSSHIQDMSPVFYCFEYWQNQLNRLKKEKKEYILRFFLIVSKSLLANIP